MSKDQKLGQSVTLTIPEMAEAMSISLSTAYALAKRPDFPAFHISPNRIVVSRAGLAKWIDEQLAKKGCSL